MSLSSELNKRREANAKAIAAFGVAIDRGHVGVVGGGVVRTLREGKKVTIYTVGYERRDGEELMSVLRDQGVRALADVRQRPMSRKPDFRATALKGFCVEAGIEYQPWPMLGSTVEQRDQLLASGDFRKFATQFRAYAIKTMGPDLQRLAESAKRTPTALLCYERLHEDCHRSVVADLIADELDASIVAIG